MTNIQNFEKNIFAEARLDGPSILLGKAKLDGEVVDVPVTLPLKMLNRHGLIAGATGTGKTKTVQILCEQLSQHGIPSMVMDIKGDLSGLAMPGDVSNTHIQKRHASLGFTYEADGFPVELMSIGGRSEGVALRSTVTEFGPILFSKILGLSDTQSGVMSLVFQFCDDRELGLVDLDDVRTVLKYLTSDEGKEKFEDEYGRISPATLGALVRKIVTLEQQGAGDFFGEPSFEVADLLETQKIGEEERGVISIVRTMDLQSQPQLFSTFMLSLLAEIYQLYPEVGDVEKPKLMLVIDEAHLIFKHATRELIDQLETVVKLIRSKGVGVVFVTQLPDDIPDAILSQLGFKIQHQLRGVTARDRTAIKKAVENYPVSEWYEADRLIMELGIGEAFVTCLDEKGRPTPLVHTYLRAPMSRMDILTPGEILDINTNSLLTKKYSSVQSSQSAHEILQKEMQTKSGSSSDDTEGSIFSGGFEKVMKSKFAKTILKEGGNMLVRGILGAMGLKVDGRRTFF